MKSAKSYWNSLESSKTINVNGVDMTIRQYKAMVRKRKAEKAAKESNND